MRGNWSKPTQTQGDTQTPHRNVLTGIRTLTFLLLGLIQLYHPQINTFQMYWYWLVNSKHPFLSVRTDISSCGWNKMYEVLHQCGQDWLYVPKVKNIVDITAKFSCKLRNLWLCLSWYKNTDLEAMFSDSYSQADIVPRLRVSSCFPAVLPHSGLDTMQAVKHPGGELTCSKGINWTWVICPGMTSQTISEFN